MAMAFRMAFRGLQTEMEELKMLSIENFKMS